jgi:hypothetical protein
LLQWFMDERYRRTPQMRDYDRNEPHLRPYVTFAAQPGYRSDVLNTDAEGFRVSDSPLGPIDCARWLELGGGGLVLGGSFAFGTGATCDAATVPSRLAFLRSAPQLNLGIAAGNSLQGVIAAIPFLEHAATVVVCCGASAIVTSLQSLGLNDTYEPLRFESALSGLGTMPIGALVELTLSPERAREEREGRLRAPKRSRFAAPAGPEEWARRLDDCLRGLVRDLRILSLARRRGARTLLCFQPRCDPARRVMAPEELELLELNARRRAASGPVNEFLNERWESCAERLAADCAAIGVEFLNLAAERFTGWSFLDQWHLNDHGYGQAAAMIHEALSQEGEEWRASR